MVCAERLLADRQRALVEPLGVGVLALRPVHVGQVVEGLRHIGMAGAERLLPDRQRTLVEPLGVGVLALRLVHERQVVEGGAVIGVVDAKTRLHHGFKLLRFHERCRIIARSIELIECS